MIKDKQAVNQLVNLSFSIIISGALLIAVVAVFYGSEIMHLMYTQNVGESVDAYNLRIDQSAGIFQLLMFSFVAISSNYIFGTLLTANNNLKVLNLVALTGLLVNLSLNIILIPRLQAMGSAYASLSTQAVTALLQFYIAHRFLRLKINFGLIARFIALVLLLLMVGYGLPYLHLESWIVSMLMMLVLGVLFIVALGLLNIKQLIGILKGEL